MWTAVLAHRSKKDVGVGVPDDPCPFAAAVTSAGGYGIRPRLSKKVCSPLGPLCEGAPPAGGGGENCAVARNISGYGKVLSLRPFGAPPSQREVFRHAGADFVFALGGKNSTIFIIFYLFFIIKKAPAFPQRECFSFTCFYPIFISTGFEIPLTLPEPVYCHILCL